MNASPNILEVSVRSFQQEVVEKSRQLPVVLEFYAVDAPPSKALAPVLRKLADEFVGKFVLARVNVQENQQIVQQLGVRTLPTVKIVVNAQIVQNLEGEQSEARLREVLQPLVMSSIERIREQINQLLLNGDRQSAIQMLHEAIIEEPKNTALQSNWLTCWSWKAASMKLGRFLPSCLPIQLVLASQKIVLSSSSYLRICLRSRRSWRASQSSRKICP